MEDEDLLQRILDNVQDPTNLSLVLLQKITGNFSEERKIGQGGFGVVYKGVLGEWIVAVKRIYINGNTVDDKSFRGEVTSLMKVNHQNVVRFLGFCSNTHCEPINHAESGGMVLVNVLERLVCLEYISNGSLDKHITDELRGFEWETRYKIITEICEGLCYLHEEKHIVHMDLKPANILLDDQMVPKITDFGLSRSNKNSRTMAQPTGTRGYIAPEYEKHGKTSPKADIYSLGAIILELVTGCMGIPDENNVLRRWRHRWSKPPTSLQYHQVTGCIHIAGRCRKIDPKERPSISEIISFLSKSESKDGQITPRFDEDDMLGIKPLELRLPSDLKKEISCSIELTNSTHSCIAFNIQPPSRQWYITQPDNGVVPPVSMYVVTITVKARDVHEHDLADKFIVQSMEVGEGLSDQNITERMFEKSGKAVDKVDLMVIYEPAKSLENSRSKEDTNMPAEEVPKREFDESASGKDKNDLGSSENATSKMQRQLPLTPIQAGEDNVSGKQSSTARRHHSPVAASRTYGSRQARSPLARLPAGICTHDISAPERMNALLNTTLWVVGKALAPGADGVLGHWDSSKKLGLNVEALRSELLRVKATLETARLKHIAGDAMAELLGRLRDSAHSADDMLDELDYFRIHDKLAADQHARQQAGWFIWPFASPRSPRNSPSSSTPILRFNRVDVSERMKHVVDQLQLVHRDFANILRSCHSITVPDIAQSRPVTTGRSIEPKLYGRDNIMNSIIHDMTKDKYHNNDLTVLPIVGPGGIGKTTMIQHIYRNEEVQKHFQVVIWVCVSLKFNLNKVLEEIETYIPPVDGEKITGRVEELIEQRLKSKKFLLVLDDIWECSTEDDWEMLLLPLKASKEKGNMILITTRFPAVAKMVGTTEHSIELDGLESKYFSELFHAFVFDDDQHRGDYKFLLDTGDKIMEKLKGSPLAAKTVGRLLRNCLNLGHWRSVLENKVWESQTGANDIMPALKLSYDYLPFHQQQCFSCSALFPEDHKYSSTELINLWIGLDILQPGGCNQKLEDIGLRNLNDLVTHGFFKEEETNDSPCYVMHDLLHDLALKVSSHDSVSVHRSNVRSVAILPSIRHLSIIIDHDDIVSPENFASELINLKTRLRVHQLHTLMLFGEMDERFAKVMGDLFREANALRVLRLVDPLSSVEPMLDNFSALIHLRYLWLGGKEFLNRKEIYFPLVICRFYHLRILDLRSWWYGFQGNLPKDLSNLAKLCRFYTHRDESHSKICNVGKLVLLEELKVFRVNKESAGFEPKQLEHLTQLRELGIFNLENIHTKEEAATTKLIEKNYLERLTLDWFPLQSNVDPAVEALVLESLQPHRNLQELCIRGHRGPSCPTWLGDELTVNTLQSLHLDSVSWQCLPPLGKMWDLTEVQLINIDTMKEFVIEQSFCRLISLHLYGLGSFEKWVPSQVTSMFPLLQVLSIEECPKLLGLPFSNLNQDGNIDWFPNLQKLEVKGCQKFMFVAPIPWTETLRSVRIWDVKLLESVDYSPKSSHGRVSLEICGKKDLQSLDQVLAFTNLAGLEELKLEMCPPLGSKHLIMLTSLMLLDVYNLDGLVGPLGGGCDVEWQHPLERLVVGDVACKGPTGKELTEVLTHLPRLSDLEIKYCKNITHLPVGADVSATPPELEDEKDGLLLFPAHLSDSLQELRIRDCENLVLVDPSTFLPASGGGGGLQTLRFLQSLEISSWGVPSCQHVFLSASSCLFPSSLRHLYIHCVEGLGTLEPLSNLTSLTQLILHTCGRDLRCKGLGPLLTAGGQLRGLYVKGSPRFFAGWDPIQEVLLQQEGEGGGEQLVSPPAVCSSKLEHLTTDDAMGLLVVPICSFLSSSLNRLQLHGTFGDTELFTEEQEDALHLLASLQQLEFSEFRKLQHLPAGLHKLTRLKRLQVSYCPAVRTLPKDGLPKSLQELVVHSCGNVELTQQCRGLVGTIPKIILD